VSTVKGGVYQRGEFWLDFVRGAGGAPASDRFYIWWYDDAAGRLQRKSTRTSSVRIACDKLDDHYLATHRPTPEDQAIYSVGDALADYWIEHGAKQTSSEAIKARLAHMRRFLDHEADAGRLLDPFLPEHLDERFLARFREWALLQPIVAQKKDEAGNWIDGASRPRSASTVEESVIALKAALNHAFDARRTKYVPPLKHKTRDQVTPERSYRLSIDALAELLDYTMHGAGKYGGHADRLLPFRRYLIGAICTIARPDAVLDIRTIETREQWQRDDRRLALNPAGRIQTKKVRPVLPVVDLLHSWLDTTDDWLVCKELRSFDARQQIDVVEQMRVRAIRSAWDTARDVLGIPAGYGPKLIRHSMATILANRRVDPVELEIAMGHRPISKTTGRYVIFDPDYLASFRGGVEDVIADLTRKAGPALHAKVTQKSDNVHVLRA
jgi:hypothetical protein